MKKFVVFLASLFITFISVAQNEMDEIKVTAPTFKGEFYKSINALLKNGVEYPTKSKNAGLQGTAVIDFTVTVNGELTDFQVINSVSPEIDEEIISVLQVTSGKWIPGTSNGKAVEMQKEVSVSFKINPDVDFVAEAKKHLEKANEMLFVKNKPSKALKYYNRGITLLPHEEVLLAMRGLCNYEMGNEDEARMDWERIARSSTTSFINEYALEASVLKGYEELSQVMNR